MAMGNGEWGMGDKGVGGDEGDEGDEGEELITNAQCPMPDARCPMPDAQCPFRNEQLVGILPICRYHYLTSL
jgi:hypothetical protein